MKRLDERGFTMPELLTAMGLIVLLMVPTFWLLRAKDFAPEQRNAQRRLGAAQLVRAAVAYQKDKGTLPPALTTKSQLIGSASQGAVNICGDLLPHYLKAMPSDPLVTTPAGSDCNKSGTQYVTGYAISKSADGQHVTVTAPLAEAGERVSITH